MRPIDTQDPSPNPPRARTALALGLAAIVALLAMGGTDASFVPPWNVTPKPLGGVWPPLLAVAWGLAILVAARGALQLGWNRLSSHLPEGLATRIDPGPKSPQEHPGLDRWDWILMGILCGAMLAIVETYRFYYNPESRCIGHDNYAFLSGAVAAGSGRWDLYMVDKRPLFGIITALFAQLTDGDYVRAAVRVNTAAVAVLPVPTYLIGRLFSGRWAGLGAGIMLLGVSLMYPFAHETASYALYNLATTAAIASVAWALMRPSARTYLVAGVLMGIVTLTQVKNFTFNLPLGGLLILGLLLDGAGRRWLRASLMAGPVALAVTILSLYPVDFTPLNVLIMHHREEVHYEIPYEWADPKKPDPAFPSPISGYLPEFLRWGEFEGVAATMLTGPDSHVMAAFPGDGPGRRWSHCPGTTIPPWGHRVSHNLQQADTLAPGLGALLFPLAGLGFVLTLLGRLRDSMEPRRGWRAILGPSWWHAGLLLVPLFSCMGSLSLKFNFRYVFHFVPTTLVLVALAAVGLGRLALPRAGGVWTVLTRLVALGLCLSMAIALYIRAPLLRVGLDETILRQAFFRLPPDHRQLMGKGMDLVSQYITQHAPEGAEIYDCTPISLGLFIPEDSRLIRPKNGSERDRLCANQAKTVPGDTPRVLVVTSIPEFFGPDVVTPAKVRRAGDWTLAYGYDIHGPRELGSPEDWSKQGPGWIAVMVDTPDETVGTSMLDGEPPGIWVLEPGSPALPSGDVGAPEAGNP